jgi:predicted O-methyltransferase YrrM
MSPKAVKNLPSQILLTTFQLVPVRLIKKVLDFLYSNPTVVDRWGYHLRPFHYYEPLPDFSTITQEQALKKRYSRCVDWNLETQLYLVEKLSKYDTEIKQLSFDFFNDFYRELDAAIYYALLRENKPTKVIEIGCGYSTQISALALYKNQQEGKTGKIICIEPYPESQLTEANLEVELITERVENIDLKVFAQLAAGDILFIDSTHTVKFSSDVCREILEILPTISSGVLIHFHDIFFPYDYPPKWLIEERRAWNEQYMLEAFMAYNHSFEILLANHLLSVDYPQEVAKIWQDVSNWQGQYHRCGSFWIRKK